MESSSQLLKKIKQQQTELSLIGQPCDSINWAKLPTNNRHLLLLSFDKCGKDVQHQIRY